MAASVAAIAWSRADDEFSFESVPFSAGDAVSSPTEIIFYCFVNTPSAQNGQNRQYIPFTGINGATAANGGRSGNAAAIGGNTPAIVDEVIAAIALAAFAARLLQTGNWIKIRRIVHSNYEGIQYLLIFGNFILDFNQFWWNIPSRFFRCDMIKINFTIFRTILLPRTCRQQFLRNKNESYVVFENWNSTYCL